MQYQGVLTRMCRENSLILHGKGKILGVLRFAPQISRQGSMVEARRSE